MRLLSNLTIPKLVAFITFGSFLAVVGAQAGRDNLSSTVSSDHAIVTASGLTIPSGSWGIVHLRNARQGKLLHLRGIAGEGKLVLRTDENGVCETLPIELVAGDFGGDTIGIQSTGAISLAIQSRTIANKLRRGRDIASDDYFISEQSNDPLADIILLKGLEESYGFIIDPGHSFIDTLFGIRFRNEGELQGNGS